MALPVSVPYTFGTANGTVSLSWLDSDFSTITNTINGIGNGTVTLTNPTITTLSTSNISVTNLLATTANVTTLNLTNNLSSSKVNFQSSLSNSVSRTASSKMADWVSVFDFGAVGDNTTDDATAIQNAINSCQTNGKCLYFPEATYKINTGLTLNSLANIFAASGAALDAHNASIDAITLTSGNYTSNELALPNIYNASNGLVLYGANLTYIYIANIAGCTNGIVLKIDNTYKSCADNTIKFNALNSLSGSGVLFNYLATTTSGTLMQGNEISGNFITSTKYGIQYYDVNNGSLLNLPWDDTYIKICAIDGANITGSIGLYGNPSFPPARCTHDIYGFFGGFASYLISGGGNNNIFRLAFSQAAPYAQMNLTGAGNRLIDTSSGQSGFIGVSTPIALTTSPNTRSSFNSGNPIGNNRFLASITLSTTLAAGSTAIFYFYHPLMTNYNPKVTIEPWWSVPLVPLYCVENSTSGVGGPSGETPYPFQGSLAVLATSSVSAGTYKCYITVHDAPQ